VERRLRIVGADVERDVAGAVRRLSDAAADSSPFFSTIPFGISPGTLCLFPPNRSPLKPCSLSKSLPAAPKCTAGWVMSFFLLDHRVRHVAGNLLRLPAEQLAVEALQFVEVLAGDLEVHDGMCHVVLLSHISGACVTQGSSPGSPPAAAVSRRGR